MSVLRPPENQAEHGHRYVVFRRDEGKLNSWESLETVVAPDPATAFRKVVLRPGEQPRADIHGEYRVFSMEGSAHLGAELHLRDLEAEEASLKVEP